MSTSTGKPKAKRPIRPDCHRMPRVTTAEAAEIAGVSIQTIYKWCHEGGLIRSPGKSPYCIDRLQLHKWAFDGVAANPELAEKFRIKERNRSAAAAAKKKAAQ